MAKGKRKMEAEELDKHDHIFNSFLSEAFWNQEYFPTCWVFSVCNWIDIMCRFFREKYLSSVQSEIQGLSPQEVINHFHLSEKEGVYKGYHVHKAIKFIHKRGLPLLSHCPYYGIVNPVGNRTLAWMFHRCELRHKPLQKEYDHYELTTDRHGNNAYYHNRTKRVININTLPKILNRFLNQAGNPAVIATFEVGGYFCSLKSWEIYDEAKEWNWVPPKKFYQRSLSAKLADLNHYLHNSESYWSPNNKKGYHSMIVTRFVVEKKRGMKHLEVKNSYGLGWGVPGFGRFRINQKDYPIIALIVPRFNI